MIRNISITQLLILVTYIIGAQSRLDISAALEQRNQFSLSGDSDDGEDIIPVDFQLKISPSLSFDYEDAFSEALLGFLRQIIFTVLISSISMTFDYFAQNSDTIVNVSMEVILIENSAHNPVTEESLNSDVIGKLQDSQGTFNDQIEDEIQMSLSVVFEESDTFEILQQYSTRSEKVLENISPEIPSEEIETLSEEVESSLETSEISYETVIQPLNSTNKTGLVVGFCSAVAMLGVLASTVVIWRKRRKQENSSFQMHHDEEIHVHEETHLNKENHLHEGHHHEETRNDEYRIEVCTDSSVNEIYDMNNIEIALRPKNMIT